MKRLLPFVLCFWLAPWALQAQFTGTYSCLIEVRIRDTGNGSNHCTNYYDMSAKFVGEPDLIPWWNQQNVEPENGWQNFSKTIPFDGAKRLESIWTKGHREYRSWDTYHYICRNATNSNDEATNAVPATPTFTRTYTRFIESYDESVKVTVSPGNVNVYYMTSATTYDNVNKDFPTEHPMTLKAYPDAPYTWEYRRTGTTTWTALPAAYQNKPTVTLKGYDIFTEAVFLDILKNNQNVEFRVKYNGNVKRNFTVYPKLSAPNIVGLTTVMETCHQSSDAQIKLCFSRDLKPGEKLNIQLNGRITNGEGANITTFTDKCFTIHGLDPGDYDIKLLGTYDVDGKPDVDATYTGGGDPTHERDTNIEARLPITNFNATPYDVHCYAGEDGRITVTAEGGAHAYTAYLELDGDTIQQTPFAEGALGTFQNLKASPDYIVRLKDINQCDPKETNGDVRVDSVEIKQPTDSVLLSTLRSEEPLGFGLKNGLITMRSEGGTKNYTFTWTDVITSASMVPDISADAPSSDTSRMSGIGKGRYHIRVEDANYALASTVNVVNLKGCFDTLTVDLDQPPLLEVFAEEFHYVSCYGFDDGAMVAHAKGGRPYAVNHTLHPYRYEWFVVDGSTLTSFDEADSIAENRPAAVYRVKITDRNGIIAWSPDYTLIQPMALNVSFNTPELLCNGDTNGTSHAIVIGGTPDYHYAWSTEDTTAQISNLTDGLYSVVITDDRGCTLFGQTEVTVPNSLGAEAVLDFPTCQGYTDGGVELTVTGGRAPYRYVWSNSDTTAVITGIGEGDYHVRVTDGNGCFILRDYALEDPALFNVELGPDRTLCKDQVLNLNVTLEDANTQYAWTKDGASFANTPAVVLTESGTYHVAITDSKGCNNNDEIRITRSDVSIEASIIVASRAPQYERVRVANISFPAPDRVEWIIPEGATVIEEQPEYLDLSFTTKAEYTIGLISFKGSCEKFTETTVKIVSKSELKDYQAPNEPYIKQFGVTPNPNNGKFTASVQLREAGDFALALLTTQGTVVERYDFKNEFYTRTDFDVSNKVGKGVYVLQLVTREGYATFKIVIQ